MPWYYAPWISNVGSFAIVVACVIFVGIALIIISNDTPKPRRPKLLSSADIQTALRIAAERTRNERPRHQPTCPDRGKK